MVDTTLKSQLKNMGVLDSDFKRLFW